MEESKATKQVRDFLISLKTHRESRNRRAYAYLVGDTISSVKDGMCHAALKAVNNPISLGGGFLPNEFEMKIAEKFWNWVSDPKTSPWRKLLVNGIELVKGEDGLPVGWMLPEETLKSTPFDFQKNFCILTRVFTEKHSHFKVWSDLVDKKVNPSDAFFLCGKLETYGNTGGYSLSIDGSMSGSHWPITESNRYFNAKHPVVFDFKAFRSGEIHTENPMRIEEFYAHIPCFEKINGFFQSRKKNLKERIFDISKTCKIKTGGSRFSTVGYYDLDEIIDEFYKWQDVEGILDDR